MLLRISREVSSPCGLFSPSAGPTLLCLSVSVLCLAGTMTVGNMESAELFDAGKKGRGLRATKELNAGEVVFAEAGFSAVVFDRYEAPGCCSFYMDRLDVFSLM